MAHSVIVIVATRRRHLTNAMIEWKGVEIGLPRGRPCVPIYGKAAQNSVLT